MTTIILPVVFEVCDDCGEHGLFRFPDRSRSKEVCSKAEAISELATLFYTEKVSTAEFFFLWDEVKKSKLATENSEVNKLIRLYAQKVNRRYKNASSTEKRASIN